MMNYARVQALFLLAVFLTSCRQNQHEAQKDSTTFDSANTVTAYGPSTMVRNVRRGNHNTILMAASVGGVFRYDGKSFTKLTGELGPRRFWDVLEDRRGNWWVSTTDSGVYYYSGTSVPAGQTGLRHFTTREGLASNAVGAMYEDKAGMIWFCTGGGLSRYDPGQVGGKLFKNFTTKDGLPNNDITAILTDKTGSVWIGSRGEACVYDGNRFTVFKNKDGEPFHNVRAIIEDKKGNIWFGASIIKRRKGNVLFVDDGLWRYDGSAFTLVTQRSTSAILEDEKGNIWTTGAVKPNGVGAWKLLRYDQKTLYNKKPTVTEILSIEKMLCGILEATDGSIWFGSLSGVYRYDGKTIMDVKNKERQK